MIAAQICFRLLPGCLLLRQYLPPRKLGLSLAQIEIDGVPAGHCPGRPILGLKLRCVVSYKCGCATT